MAHYRRDCAVTRFIPTIAQNGIDSAEFLKFPGRDQKISKPTENKIVEFLKFPCLDGQLLHYLEFC
jgi:hypothetical protein